MHPKSALVVEDDSHDGFFIGQALASLSPAPVVRYAVTLDQAFILMEEHASDLVLIDIGLPVISGGPDANPEDIVRFVRIYSKVCKMVALTGSNNVKLLSRLQKAGLEGWWDKSFITDPDSFRREIEDIAVATPNDSYTEKLDAIMRDTAKTRRMLPVVRILGVQVEELTAICAANTEANKANATAVGDLTALVKTPAASAIYMQGVTDEQNRVKRKTLLKRAAIYGSLAAGMASIYQWGQVAVAFIKGLEHK